MNVDIGENKITEGVIMIKRKLIDLLLSHGLSMLDVKVGDEFSPVNMEAVSSLPVKDIKKNNKVMEILQKGYINKQTGKTFKNAVVVIGKKS